MSLTHTHVASQHQQLDCTPFLIQLSNCCCYALLNCALLSSIQLCQKQHSITNSTGRGCVFTGHVLP
jgi:hypothetical protein